MAASAASIVLSRVISAIRTGRSPPRRKRFCPSLETRNFVRRRAAAGCGASLLMAASQKDGIAALPGMNRFQPGTLCLNAMAR